MVHVAARQTAAAGDFVHFCGVAPGFFRCSELVPLHLFLSSATRPMALLLAAAKRMQKLGCYPQKDGQVVKILSYPSGPVGSHPQLNVVVKYPAGHLENLLRRGELKLPGGESAVVCRRRSGGRRRR